MAMSDHLHQFRSGRFVLDVLPCAPLVISASSASLSAGCAWQHVMWNHFVAAHCVYSLFSGSFNKAQESPTSSSLHCRFFPCILVIVTSWQRKGQQIGHWRVHVIKELMMIWNYQKPLLLATANSTVHEMPIPLAAPSVSAAGVCTGKPAGVEN